MREAVRRLIEHQRRAAERVRREVLRADGSLRRPYHRGLARRLRSYLGPASEQDVVDAAAGARLILVGDFHALPGCQAFAARLLARLARRVDRLLLGIEFAYTRQQPLVDRRQAGLVGDAEFLRRIRYRDEWGHPWEGYRALLDTAREHGVAVHALDAAPRGGPGGLGRRDRHAARRVAALLAADPCASMLVLFGESHLAPEHLPRRIGEQTRRRGIDGRTVLVFQNPDALYWEAVAREPALPPALRVGADTWAVFHATPLEKYEAYRQVLARWDADAPPDAESDLTPAAHHLIGVLASWLGIASTRRLRHRAGWSEEFGDALPEVYAGAEARELLGPILDEHGRSAAERREAQRALALRGALYDVRSNTLFLDRYLPGPAAGEGARFLRAALTGRLFIAADDFADDPIAAAYGAAYNEGLAYLGSRLVDPTSDYLSGAAETGRDRASHGGWIDRHVAFERSGAAVPPVELAVRLRGSRALRRALARDLGRRIGAVLFGRVRSGHLRPAELRRLFARPLEPRTASAFVLAFLRP